MNVLGKRYEEEPYDAEEDLRLLGEDPMECRRPLIERMKESLSGRKEKEQVRLPEARRKHYQAMLSSLTAVIAAASCVLVVMLMGTSARQNAANAQNTQALAEKLGRLEESLNKVDVQVVNDAQLAAAHTETYEELGDTVSTLKSNLTNYRDGNEITDEEIGTNLDGVIAQLDEITAALNAAKSTDQSRNSALGEKLDSMSEDSASKSANLSQELDAVHVSIKALIEATGKEGKEEYAELKGILAATDTSLSDLVSSKFDETGTLIAKTREQLVGDIAGVSSSVTTGFGNVSTSLESVNTTLGTGMETVSTGVTNVGTAVQTVDSNVTNVQASVNNLQSSLSDSFSENKSTLNEMTSMLGQLKGSMELLGTRQESENDQLGKALDALKTANERIAGLEGQVASLQGNVAELREAGKEETSKETTEEPASEELDEHEVSTNLVPATE